MLNKTKEVFLMYCPRNRVWEGETAKLITFVIKTPVKDRISLGYWLNTARKGLTGLKFWKRKFKYKKESCH